MFFSDLLLIIKVSLFILSIHVVSLTFILYTSWNFEHFMYKQIKQSPWMVGTKTFMWNTVLKKAYYNLVIDCKT